MSLEPELAKKFLDITHKLWGKERGDEFHKWIVDNRPPYFHEKLVRVMVPIWEMNKVDLKTKILCGISAFTALHRDEVEFFMHMAAYHGIQREEVEEILLLVGLESGFPNAEHAILILMKVYKEYENK